jgi:hypothetical protein
MPRCNLGSCALGLALLAGCLAPTDEAPPVDSPADPPLQPPVTEPYEPPPPDLEPPAPPSNVPGDEYDAAQHRVLYADCAAGALMSVDLAGGERRVVADAWPWSEPASRVCVDGFVVAPGGGQVYAVVERSFPEPGGADVSCSATEVVAIETASGKVTSLSSLSELCCGDCGRSRDTHALQVDEVGQRLLRLDESCTGSACDSQLASTGLSASASPLQRPVSSDQAGDARAQALTFDPAAPQSSVLVLLDDLSIDRLDFTTGARDKVASIQAAWEDEIEIQYTTGITVDPDNQRQFVAAVALWPGPDALFVVVEVDLESGEQTLLYDGRPGSDGAAIACHPEPSFDTRDNRILMVEPIDSSGCAGRVFAVDATTGELTLLAGAAP